MTPSLRVAREVDADDFRREKIDRLPEHARLGLNTPDAPSDDAEAIDHGRVRVGADKGVRIIDGALGGFRAQDSLGEVFEIDLVNDADSRRNHAEGLKGLLAPFEELIAFAIPLEFYFEVQAQRIGRTEEVHLHRVIDHKIHRHQRLDDLGILLQFGDRGAHCCEIDQERHAGEVLQHDARDDEGNLLLRGRLCIPCGQSLDVLLRNLLAIAVAEHRFKHDADTDGQAGYLPESFLFQRRQGIIKADFAFAGVEGAQCIVHRLLLPKTWENARAIC